MDPLSKTIVDKATISPTDFAYLMVCRPRVFIYRSALHIHAKVDRPDSFCRQFGYNQQLPGIDDSQFLANTRLMEAKVH